MPPRAPTFWPSSLNRVKKFGAYSIPRTSPAMRRGGLMGGNTPERFRAAERFEC